MNMKQDFSGYQAPEHAEKLQMPIKDYQQFYR